jgi:beta-glucosidase
MSRDNGKLLRFPEEFLWGTATSPTQTEGHIQNEWTDIVAVDGSICRVACDSYHRYREDIEWVSKLGVNAYRFGIEWSRLQAAPFAPLEQRELARYVELLDGLVAANITPMVVLHHFSNPPWLNQAGGWTQPQAIPAFVDYVGKLVAALKDRVTFWNTFNEPDTYACLGYLMGGFPPQCKWNFGKFRRVITHMAKAHEQASAIIRREGRTGRPPQVGIAKNWTFFHAYNKSLPWDRLLAFGCHYIFNKFVLNAFLGGKRRAASTFIGLNYYGRVRFHHGRGLVPASGAKLNRLEDLGFNCDDMFERYPEGFGEILEYLHRKFSMPLYITEHGAASADEAFRERDLRDYLTALHAAMGRGADVRGFFYWSLLDNFEWQFGYSKKFGLVSVDFNDARLPRRMKPLGEIYRTICSQRAVSVASGINGSSHKEAHSGNKPVTDL